MNPKTTLVLAIALVVVVGLLWLAGGDRPPETTPPDTTTKLLENTPLIDEDFGDPVKVVCQQRDGSAWTFERAEAEDESPQPEWNLTEPLQAKATGWQVSGIVRRLTQLQYQVKFPADGPGAVSATAAGLDPPACEVTLENEGGTSITVEVGKEFAERQTYVRLDGAGDVYAVSGSLDNLLKDQAIEYRDLRLVKFDKAHLKRLEITDRPEEGEPTTCVAVRSEVGWTLEVPVKAAAVKDKLDAVANTLAGLSVTEWVEAEADNLAIYGLDEPGLTVRVRVEEPPPEPAEEPGREDTEDEAEGDEAAEVAPLPEPVVREFVVRVSRRSPIGDATKVYACLDGERAVGTMAKTVADRLTPDLTEWRDLRLARADVTAADRVELITPQGEAVFVKQAGVWVEETSGASIEKSAVTELLNQIKDLKAQNLVELGELDAESLGFDAPQATIRLNVPGEPEASRLVVGGYTDPELRRLVYVRADDADQVAKVRVADVGKLIRDPSAYRDRTVFDLKPDRFEKIVISRPDELTEERFTFTLSKVDERLQITEPVQAKTSAEQVTKLTTALGGLKATQVMPEADPAGYGLDDPEVTCEMVYLPPEITKMVEVEPAETEETSGDEAEAPQPKFKPEEYQPPAEDYTILVASHQGKTYAMREDLPVIYEVPRTVLALLQGEYHEQAVLDFEQSQVTGVAVAQTGAPTHEFAKVNDQWQYAPEPDLPIDPKRVQDLLLRIRDLSSERFVAYDVTDLAAYGLDEPEYSVTVTLADGAEQCLIVSPKVCEGDPAKRRYATVADSGEVFLVTEGTINRFEIDLEEYEAP